MISYIGYKVLHLAGIFMVLLSLAGLIVNRSFSEGDGGQWRKHLTILNGVGLVIVLIAGFGLLARLDLSWPWDGWLFVKLLIWLLFGASISMVNRFANSGRILLSAALVLAVVAAYLANTKPF